jgi:hypothetical protein
MKTEAELRTEIHRVIREAFNCGFDAESEGDFEHCDACLEADKAIDEFLAGSADTIRLDYLERNCRSQSRGTCYPQWKLVGDQEDQEAGERCPPDQTLRQAIDERMLNDPE